MNTNNSVKSFDMISVIGLFLFFVIPVMFYILSINNEEDSMIRCSRQDGDTKEITYDVEASFKGVELDSIEFIINYDVTKLNEKVKNDVLKDERNIGEQYKNENNVMYSIIEGDSLYSLHVYGDKDDIVKFYDANFASNKTFLTTKLDDSGFVCEEVDD